MSSLPRRHLPALTGAAVLILAIAGSAAAATLQFDDLDGNGVADTCQTAVVADPEAAAAAFAAVDADGDGMISVTEAANSGRTGGTNCNHGGFVSSVAAASAEDCDEAGTTEPVGDETVGDEAIDEAPAGTDAADCDEAEDGDEAVEAADQLTPEDAPADCATPADAAPETDEPSDATAPNAHGKAVSEVAKSDAVGGKNCNHGGAVSEAAKGDHAAKVDHAAKKADHAAAMAAKKADHAAAMAAKKADHAAAMAARREAKALAKAQREAAHQAG